MTEHLHDRGQELPFLDQEITERAKKIKHLEGRLFLEQLYLAGLMAAKNAALRRVVTHHETVSSNGSE